MKFYCILIMWLSSLLTMTSSELGLRFHLNNWCFRHSQVVYDNASVTVSCINQSKFCLPFCNAVAVPQLMFVESVLLNSSMWIVCYNVLLQVVFMVGKIASLRWITNGLGHSDSARQIADLCHGGMGSLSGVCCQWKLRRILDLALSLCVAHCKSKFLCNGMFSYSCASWVLSINH